MSRYKSVSNIPVLKLGEDSSSSPNPMCDFFSGLTLRLCLAGLLGEAALPTPDMVHSRALQFLKGDEGPGVWGRQAGAWLYFLPAHLHPEAFLPGPGEHSSSPSTFLVLALHSPDSP